MHELFVYRYHMKCLILHIDLIIDANKNRMSRTHRKLDRGWKSAVGLFFE